MAVRAALRRPKVNQQRDLVALQVLVKCGLGHFDRIAGEQRLLALPGIGRAGKLVGTHAVGGLAVGADYVQGFTQTGQLVAGGLECKACWIALPESGTTPIYPLLFSQQFAHVFIGLEA